jgi:DNA end-binding protein Ku
VRTPDFELGSTTSLRKQELQMAGSLIESMAGEFDPTAYSDAYRETLQQVIEAKVEGKEIVAVPEPEGEPAEVIDLMAALRASVEKAKKARAA